jgi:hypothetical protein
VSAAAGQILALLVGVPYTANERVTDANQDLQLRC